MANEFYISAGLPPNDNDPGDNPNTFHISAGLVPDDVSGEEPTLPINFTQQRRISHTNIRR